MSAKTKRVERGQRFRRAWRGENRTRAVSPVVATLILILIAVAAAAALYLWLVVWQGNITGGVGSPHAQSTLTIGGSTSAYPFTSLGATWFEQNESDIAVSDNQGGTGAGMIAVCAGNIQLGASSTPMTVALLEDDYGCPSQYASSIVITTIAYDAVDVVIDSGGVLGGPHGLFSISADTLNAVYEAGSSTAGHYICSIDGVELSAASCGTGTLDIAVAAGTPLDWQQIPAATFGATVAGVTETNVAVTVDAAGGEACTAAGFANDICATAADATPCGFTVCAGPYSATGAVQAIDPISRSDASGTTQTFEAKLLGYGAGPSTSDSSWAGEASGTPWLAQTSSATFANLGYGGCGSNNLLTDCGWTFTSAQQGNGNPGVLSLVAGNPNAIGYASDGLARTTSGIGLDGIVPFLGLGQGIETSGTGAGVTPTLGYNGFFSDSSTVYQDGGIIPTTGTSGTIAAGLTASASVNNYVGGRPFQLISLEPLSGTAQEFVTFITDPATNAALATATAEVGLYQVVP